MPSDYEVPMDTLAHDIVELKTLITDMNLWLESQSSTRKMSHYIDVESLAVATGTKGLPQAFVLPSTDPEYFSYREALDSMDIDPDEQSFPHQFGPNTRELSKATNYTMQKKLVGCIQAWNFIFDENECQSWLDQRHRGVAGGPEMREKTAVIMKGFASLRQRCLGEINIAMVAFFMNQPELLEENSDESRKYPFKTRTDRAAFWASMLLRYPVIIACFLHTLVGSSMDIKLMFTPIISTKPDHLVIKAKMRAFRRVYTRHLVRLCDVTFRAIFNLDPKDPTYLKQDSDEVFCTVYRRKWITHQVSQIFLPPTENVTWEDIPVIKNFREYNRTNPFKMIRTEE